GVRRSASYREIGTLDSGNQDCKVSPVAVHTAFCRSEAGPTRLGYMRALSFFGLCLREIPGINFLGLQQDWRALRILKRQVAIVAVIVIAVCSILPAAQLPAADAVGDSGQTDAAGTSPGSSPGPETPDLVGVATGDNKIKSGGKY